MRLLVLERRIDPLFRRGFDAVIQKPLAALVQALIRLRRPNEHLAVAEEQVLSNEDEITQRIIEHMSAFLRANYGPGEAQRAGNTKTHGVVRGTFEVLHGLPQHLRHGVFAEPRSYKAWVRFAGPGPLAPPDIEDQGVLSIGVKLMGVEGSKLIDDEKMTQDFTAISTPTFVTPDAAENVKLQRRIGEGTPLFYFLSPADSHLLDGLMQALYARTHSSPFETPYYSCVPYLMGDGQAMKFSLRPSVRERSPIPRSFPDNYLRQAMATTLALKEVSFQFFVQLQTDPHRMPVEDATIVWPERLAPSVQVATLRLPAQSFDSPEQLAFADKLSINPWHGLEDHRPLGSQNRVRRTLYVELSKLRQEMNDTARTEPTGDEVFPGGLRSDGSDGEPSMLERREDDMNQMGVGRQTGLALVASGVSFALFMILHPYDQLAGTHGPHSSAWVPAHTFHFLGALLALFGLLELRDRWPVRSGWAKLGFIAAFTGTAMFVGTGMITAFLWPAIAEHAPGFVVADGAMFTDTLASGSITATYAFLVVGYIALAVTLNRARAISTLDTALLVVGVLMFSAPVDPLGPAPWFIRVAGGIVFGAGLARLGWSLRARDEVPSPATRVAPARTT
jgi:hypothetical protein